MERLRALMPAYGLELCVMPTFFGSASSPAVLSLAVSDSEQLRLLGWASVAAKSVT